VLRRLVVMSLAVVGQGCGMPLWNPPPRPVLSLPPRDTLPVADRSAIWDAVLRFYRSGRVSTEGDRAAQVHAQLGMEPRGSLSQPAPVILDTRRRPIPLDTLPPAPYDSMWLRNVAERYLVAGFCSAPVLTSCEDTVLTTYLSLGDPYIWNGLVVVDVWETALNPALCKRRDVIVDHQGASAKLSKKAGEWKVVSHRLGWHATGSCSLERKHRR
jgi:hypothetical protein